MSAEPSSVLSTRTTRSQSKHAHVEPAPDIVSSSKRTKSKANRETTHSRKAKDSTEDDSDEQQEHHATRPDDGPREQKEERHEQNQDAIVESQVAEEEDTESDDRPHDRTLDEADQHGKDMHAQPQIAQPESEPPSSPSPPPSRDSAVSTSPCDLSVSSSSALAVAVERAHPLSNVADFSQDHDLDRLPTPDADAPSRMTYRHRVDNAASLEESPSLTQLSDRQEPSHSDKETQTCPQHVPLEPLPSECRVLPWSQHRQNKHADTRGGRRHDRAQETEEAAVSASVLCSVCLGQSWAQVQRARRMRRHLRAPTRLWPLSLAFQLTSIHRCSDGLLV